VSVSVNNTIRFQGPILQHLLFQKPQVNLARSSSTRMWLVSICAGLTIIQSALTESFASLILAVAAVAGALLTEFIIDDQSVRRFILEGDVPNRGRGFAARDGSAVASALVFTLLLPNTIHPLFAFLGAVFAMLVIKHSFGGLGTNWVNPALGAWLIIRLGWPGAFSLALQNSSLSVLAASLHDGIDPPGSPLSLLYTASPGSFDIYWTSFLNKRIFSLAASELPEGYIDLLAYSGPGIIADRGLLALLFGTIIMTASQISRFWIPLAYLGVYGCLVRIFGRVPFGGGFGAGDILFGFFSGGTLVAAFILIADPSTGPKSSLGMLIAAVLGGVLSFLFRNVGLEPYGAFFAVALLNALSPLFRFFETRFLFTGSSNELGSSGASRGGIHAKR
jgi:electron transport complex protein RnfD